MILSSVTADGDASVWLLSADFSVQDTSDSVTMAAMARATIFLCGWCNVINLARLKTSDGVASPVTLLLKNQCNE